MTRAVDIFLARINGEEGQRLIPYDDATGRPVRAPVGNLTWGRGFNLMVCGSSGLFDVMDRFLVGEIETQIIAYLWYIVADDVRRSVFLDIAYNGGLSDLLAYPKMLECASASDWPSAAAQCTEKDAKLDASRYAPLRALLLAGDTAAGA